MTSVAQLPPLRGETAQAVASATAHRAALWPAMVEMAARKPARGKLHVRNGQERLAHLAGFDNAHWWLAHTDTSTQSIYAMLKNPDERKVLGHYEAHQPAQAGMPALVGETPAIIEQASAKRARLLPVLVSLCGRVVNGQPLEPRTVQRVMSRLQRANSAAWWNKLDDSSEEALHWSAVTALAVGDGAGSTLPADFYSARRVAQRKQQAESGAALAEFLGLPALSGTPKQVQWAHTLRADFIQKWGHTDADEVQRVLLRKEAAKASFWIDASKERLSSHIYQHADAAPLECLLDPAWLESHDKWAEVTRKNRAQAARAKRQGRA